MSEGGDVLVLARPAERRLGTWTPGRPAVRSSPGWIGFLEREGEVWSVTAAG